LTDDIQIHFTESTGEDGSPNINLTHERIKKRSIEEEMKASYIDYSMSVIVGRALPDARDGLKPVHRRILYAMHEAGLASNKPYKKSARTVGDVMARYHPHGDAAIYDAMVRMAQDFSLRYPLVDGQGNFGSIDGDNAAAMRYTESRLEKIAEEMLEDIDRDTIDRQPNYDGSLEEPTVLPAKLPNLLINGASGIAVGMATNMAPHNLGEIVDGIYYLIDNPDAETPDLMEHVKGPDFPTGGIIQGISGIYSAYSTGRGRVRIRARTTFEEMKNGKHLIIVTEIPYMVNKSRLIENIASLVKDKKVDGITDLRDESDREGMRIVITLRRDAIPDVVLNQLFKHTQLESVFGIINLALVKGRPEVLSLKHLMQEFINHRIEVVTRRTEFELRKARERCHILEGLIVALEDIDNVIALIKKAANTAEASASLQETYSLSEVQSKAILEMRLQKLTSLETMAIREEHAKLMLRIEELEAILIDRQKILDIIKNELTGLKEKYGNPRRTEIDETEIDLDIEDLIPNDIVVITRTNGGYVKRIALDTYRQQRRGGKGLMGMDTKEEDYVEEMFVTRSHNYLLVFTTHGKVYWLKGYRIPEAGRRSRGKAIVNMLPGLDKDERVNAMIPVEGFDEAHGHHNLIFATRNGVVKKTPLMAYSRPRANGIWAIRLDEGDDLLTVRLSDGNMNVLITSSGGRAVLFSERELRPQGRATRGVRGIRMDPGEEVVSMIPVEPDSTILTITEHGFGKRTSVDDYRKIRRGGKGVYTIKSSERNGKVVAVRDARDGQELIATTKNGMVIRVPIDQIKVQGRNTMGVRIMRLNEGDVVTSVVVRTPDEEEDRENIEGEKGSMVEDEEKRGNMVKEKSGEGIDDEEKRGNIEKEESGEGIDDEEKRGNMVKEESGGGIDDKEKKGDIEKREKPGRDEN